MSAALRILSIDHIPILFVRIRMNGQKNVNGTRSINQNRNGKIDIFSLHFCSLLSWKTLATSLHSNDDFACIVVHNTAVAADAGCCMAAMECVIEARSLSRIPT